MSTVEEVGDKIRSAIRNARSLGFDIKPVNILRGKSCCALGACVVDLTEKDLLYNEARKRLGLGFAQSIFVARGFDGSSPRSRAKPDAEDRNEWFELGNQIRKEVQAGVL